MTRDKLKHVIDSNQKQHFKGLVVPMQQILGQSYYFPSQVAIGGYKVGNQLLLIDTGNDDSSIRKAIRGFENIEVVAIFNTHSHADHCGGNAYIEKQYHAPVYCPELEQDFVQNPILEPTYLYGAYPIETLKNKFLMAKPSKVTHIIDSEAPICVSFNGENHSFTPISLKGHSPNQYGFITPDGIAYLGDALISTEMVTKHPLIFTYHVAEHYKSLERLKTLSAKGFVIAHGGYYDQIDALITSNIQALNSTQSLLLNALDQSPHTFDQLHEMLYTAYGLNETVPLHILNRSVLKAHIAYLVDLKLVHLDVEQGKIILKK